MQSSPNASSRTFKVASWRKKQNVKQIEKVKERFNPMNIQMLPQNLYDQIYGDSERPSRDTNLIKKSLHCLNRFGLGTSSPELLKDVDFRIPKLEGANISQHFENIAIEQCGPYVKAILELCRFGLKSRPTKWSREPGWTKYVAKKNGHSMEAVTYPPDDALVFDCEVLVPESFSPVMAVAASQNSWYSWCSPRIFKSHPQKHFGVDSLIPLEERQNGSTHPNDSPRVIIGHNVSYDRARVKEQYFTEESGVRFLDTMSMHIAVSGFANEQRTVFKSTGKNETDDLSYTWLDAGSMNGLKDVLQFYCGKKLEKTVRDIFVDGTMGDVRENFDDLIDYCSRDVQATFDVLKVLFPKFCERFPHPVTMAGMLEMSMMYLPTNNNWKRFIKNSATSYSDLDKELKSTLMNIANDACQLLHEEKYKSDPWLWNLDWTPVEMKMLKKPRKGVERYEYTRPAGCDEYTSFEHFDEREKRFLNISHDYRDYKPSPLMQSVLNTYASLTKVEKRMPGYPKWYADLCMRNTETNWKPGPVNLSTLTKITPKLLRMTWNGYVLHHNVHHGWGCLVPDSDNIPESSFSSQSSPTLDDELDSDLGLPLREGGSQMGVQAYITDIPEGYNFYKLPHKSGNEYNVGSPLSHEFLSKMDEGILKSAHKHGANRCLEINQASSYWRLSRKRILSQIFLNLPNVHVPNSIKNHPDYINEDLGVILPLTVVFGTISRRGVESTWLTASNVRAKSIGSELKAMIQAPPGYTFVGADVDSQELWIASLLGDASNAKEHGCTALSWMTLQGTKSEGTDLHSKTADSIGITRDEAKVFNYARIYGSGERATRQMLKRFQPGLTEKQAAEKVKKLFLLTKGKRKYLLSTDGRYYAHKLKAKLSPEAAIGGLVTYDEVKQLTGLAKSSYGHLTDINERDLVAGRVWDGGMESEMFNKIEQIAMSMKPSTPVLGSRITTTLEPARVQVIISFHIQTNKNYHI